MGNQGMNVPPMTTSIGLIEFHTQLFCDHDVLVNQTITVNIVHCRDKVTTTLVPISI